MFNRRTILFGIFMYLSVLTAHANGLTDLKDQPFEIKGPAVVNFWATWCASCVRETTMLKELEEQYRDKNVSFLGIAVDNTDKVENFVKKNGITFEILIGGNDAIDLSKQMGNLRKGLPYMVVIDADNNFIAKFLGETSKEKLEEAIIKAVS